MVSYVNGIRVVVTAEDGLPHVRLYLKNETEPILETNRLSSTGLLNAAKAIEEAGHMAYDELDRYWARSHEQARANNQRQREELKHGGRSTGNEAGDETS